MKYKTHHILKSIARRIFREEEIRLLKKSYSNFRSISLNRDVRREVMPKLAKICHALKADEQALFQDVTQKIIEFINQRKLPGKDYEYFYSANARQPTLYASAYACMTQSLLGRLNSLSKDKKLGWIEYFDSYQSEADGLFYDPVTDSELFRKADWWGARHLALHMISAYTDLGGKPKYPFRFLEEFYDLDHLKNWLDRIEWQSAISHDDDIDNQIMNIGCLLQYQRDFWKDERAGLAVAYLQKYLLEKINPETGMWGGYDTKDPDQRSRMVQFAYHLFALFFYDHVQIPYPEKVVRHVLATQNEFGGFGVKLNSSACEDIDSIYILTKLAPMVPNRNLEIDNALKKALLWVLCNQADDGGFVFRLEEPFMFGHSNTSSEKNQGGMLPTWFRTLSLVYLINYLEIPNRFIITPCPGYEF